MLLPYLHKDIPEAGRGCLAGAVYAAAVIFPNDFQNEYLNDSKQLSEQQRYALHDVIQQNALAWAIGIALPEKIDKINILNASFLAMQRAIDALRIRPKHLLIDGNHFKQYTNISHTNIIKGYGKYLSIAAASILAKTYRDDYMNQLHAEFPVYEWNRNKGYPTHKHRRAIIEHGVSSHHRLSYNLYGNNRQLPLDFRDVSE
ncbi:MAG: ribonuclease HII [Mediterranea sp.]|jgi:ribonuclease HII|nr:ribonuclease HII [Mediterranea sp.]